MLTPQDLALVYDRYVADRRRDNLDAAATFDSWLATFWAADGLSEPAEDPDAISCLGEPASAVRWYMRRGTILGYEPGYPLGCYQVPITARLPLD